MPMQYHLLQVSVVEKKKIRIFLLFLVKETGKEIISQEDPWCHDRETKADLR